MSDKNDYSKRLASLKNQLDEVSPTLCLAKWKQTTLNLHTGTHASCCLTSSVNIPLEELEKDKNVFHNTKEDLEDRKLMLEGNYPVSCKFCWVQEENSDGLYSERLNKSDPSWARNHFDKISKSEYSDSFSPSYLEVSFSNKCNFSCSYCYSHTSSSLFQEIKRSGVYPDYEQSGSLYGYFRNLENDINTNPYINKFWEWFPEIYDELEVFRITGGEPLLEAATFKVLNHIRENKNEKLELIINTNLGMKQELVEKMIDHINSIPEGNIKSFVLVTSLDCFGESAEFIRHGLDLEKFKQNFELCLRKLIHVKVRITSTITALAVTSFDELLLYIYSLKKEYGSKSEVLISSYPLINPSFQSVQILTDDQRKYLVNAYDLMKSLELSEENPHGFNMYELNSLEKVIEHMNTPVDELVLNQNRADFYNYFNEYEKRRGKSFKKVFPELNELWNVCEVSAHLEVEEYKKQFQVADLSNKILALKNLMRIYNCTQISLFSESIKNQIHQSKSLDRFFNELLKENKDRPYFDQTKLLEKNIHTIENFDCLNYINNSDMFFLKKMGSDSEEIELIQVGLLGMFLKFATDEALNSFLKNYIFHSESNLVGNKFFEHELLKFMQEDLNFTLERVVTKYVEKIIESNKVNDNFVESALKILLSATNYKSSTLLPLFESNRSLTKSINLDIEKYLINKWIARGMDEATWRIILSNKITEISEEKILNSLLASFRENIYQKKLLGMFVQFKNESKLKLDIENLFLEKLRENPFDSFFLGYINHLDILSNNFKNEIRSLCLRGLKEDLYESFYWKLLKKIGMPDTDELTEFSEFVLDKLKDNVYDDHFWMILCDIPKMENELKQKVQKFLFQMILSNPYHKKYREYLSLLQCEQSVHLESFQYDLFQMIKKEKENKQYWEILHLSTINSAKIKKEIGHYLLNILEKKPNKAFFREQIELISLEVSELEKLYSLSLKVLAKNPLDENYKRINQSIDIDLFNQSEVVALAILDAMDQNINCTICWDIYENYLPFPTSFKKNISRVQKQILKKLNKDIFNDKLLKFLIETKDIGTLSVDQIGVVLLQRLVENKDDQIALLYFDQLKSDLSNASGNNDLSATHKLIYGSLKKDTHKIYLWNLALELKIECNKNIFGKLKKLFNSEYQTDKDNAFNEFKTYFK